MAVLTPAQALMVRADRTISDCVREMRNHKIGSILILQDTLRQDRWPNELIGIFTERDLLMHIDEIQHGGHWNKPVRTVMSSPVITLPISRLREAGDLMVEHGIRHLPIVSPRTKAPDDLLGVISMRDLFRQQLEERKERKIRSGLSIGVITEEKEDVKVLSRGLFSTVRAELVHVHPDEFAGGLPGRGELDAFIIDVDTHVHRWSDLLRQLNHATQLPITFILFDPLLHSQATVAALKLIRDADRFAVFAKPINLLALLQKLRESVT